MGDKCGTDRSFPHSPIPVIAIEGLVLSFRCLNNHTIILFRMSLFSRTPFGIDIFSSILEWFPQQRPPITDRFCFLPFPLYDPVRDPDIFTCSSSNGVISLHPTFPPPPVILDNSLPLPAYVLTPAPFHALPPIFFVPLIGRPSYSPRRFFFLTPHSD